MQKARASRVVEILDRNGIRKTSIRQDVLSVFLENEDIALSNHELEGKLQESDRVTLYRTLKTFEKKGIIHQAIDGSGVNKYAMCHADCSEHEHLDNHAHFHCENCGKTLCLEEIHTPKVNVPAGYKVDASYMVIQGTCKDCL